MYEEILIKTHVLSRSYGKFVIDVIKLNMIHPSGIMVKMKYVIVKMIKFGQYTFSIGVMVKQKRYWITS